MSDRLTDKQVYNSREMYFAVTEEMFHDGGIAWGYITVIRSLHDTIMVLRADLTASQADDVRKYPMLCGLCPGQIESADDTEWHGLGNCVPICQHCVGSGIEPDRDTIKESYDSNAVGIIKNLSMLIRRLGYKHHNAKLVTQAMNYLRGEGLQGNILRDAPDSQEAANER